jgi:hypothetical protein
MAGIAQVFSGPHFPSGKARKALILTVLFIFLGLVGAPPDASGQSLNQFQGSFPNSQQRLPNQNRFPPEPPTRFPKSSHKRKKAMLDYNFKKLKQHAQDLAELAKSLQIEIEKSNENVLSLDIVKKAKEAEELAKKIKREAKGF